MSDSEEQTTTATKQGLLSIDVTDEQREAIQELFEKNHWEWPEVSRDRDEEYDPDNVKPGHIIPQDKEREECPHCLCQPCITDESNRQFYWPANNAVPNRFNNTKRRTMYKNFAAGRERLRLLDCIMPTTALSGFTKGISCLTVFSHWFGIGILTYPMKHTWDIYGNNCDIQIDRLCMNT